MNAAKPNSRCFRLTPDRVLLTLLPLWGVLFLFEQFRWLSKGYPVLLALVSLAAMLLLLLLWFPIALVFRRRFQFTIRSLLLLTLIVSTWGSWFGVEMRAAKRQNEAVGVIEKLGGGVHYDWSGNPNPQPPGPAWLRRVLGEDFFATVDGAFLEGSQGTDGDMENLKGLTQLRYLVLSDTQVTDAGLEHLKRLPQLYILSLDSTQVTDAGLENLKGSLPLT